MVDFDIVYNGLSRISHEEFIWLFLFSKYKDINHLN